MLLIRVLKYVTSRMQQRGVYLENFVDVSRHHNKRAYDPSVTVIIPSRDQYFLLKGCVDSILKNTNYGNYEIFVIDNESKDLDALEYLDELRSQGIRVERYPYAFNFSAICNFAVEQIKSEFVCFLNNDTQVIEPEWLGCLIDHAVDEAVGIVGSKLLFGDNSIQHMGVALGNRGIASHALSGVSEIDGDRYLGDAKCFKVSAVTFACAVVRRSTYMTLRGLDERYKVGLNDVDFCLRAKSFGLDTVLCSSSSLYHFESMTRPKPHEYRGFFRAMFEVIRFLRLNGSNVDEAYFKRNTLL